MISSMHSFTRRGLRARRFPEVTRPDIAAFLALDENKQFEDMRNLRTRAAHLSGGSLGAYTALYVGVILVAFPLLGQATASWVGPFASSLSIALIVLLAGCWIAYSYIHDQHDMARAATRLAFYEEALKNQTLGGRPL
jgi:4-hydroxybenzoate polyprenyltransferase